MRTLAIDLGTKRVGLAMSDEGGRFATPLDVLKVSKPEDAIRQVLEVVRKEGVEQILLGLPLNMDDSLGPMGRQTIAWGTALTEQSKLPLIYIDERLSSFEAEQQLITRKRGGEKITRQQKKQRLDALAATHFLQAFLDGKLSPILIPES